MFCAVVSAIMFVEQLSTKEAVNTVVGGFFLYNAYWSVHTLLKCYQVSIQENTTKILFCLFFLIIINI